MTGGDSPDAFGRLQQSIAGIGETLCLEHGFLLEVGSGPSILLGSAAVVHVHSWQLYVRCAGASLKCPVAQ